MTDTGTSIVALSDICPHLGCKVHYEPAHGDPEVGGVVQAILDSPEHSWKKGMSPEERARIDAFYRERYGKPVDD